MPLAVNKGQSFRANHLFFRAGIPAEKLIVKNALQTGALGPGKRPANYGEQTHPELWRWTGVDQQAQLAGTAILKGWKSLIQLLSG